MGLRLEKALSQLQWMLWCAFATVECKTAPNLLLSVVPFKVLKRWSLVQGYYLLASFESVSFASVEV